MRQKPISSDLNLTIVIYDPIYFRRMSHSSETTVLRQFVVCAGVRLNNAWASGTVLRPFATTRKPHFLTRDLVSGFKCKLSVQFVSNFVMTIVIKYNRMIIMLA